MSASDFRRAGGALLLACGLGMIAVMPAHAQSKKDQEQVRRLRQQIQQLQQDQAAQQEAATKAAQDKAAADAALKKAQDEMGSVKNAAAGASRRAVALSKDLEAAKAERDDLKAKLAALQASLDKSQSDLKDTREKLATRDGEWSRLDAAFKAQTVTLGQCQDRNAKLYQLGSELLGRYQNKGFGEVMSTREPFTQIKRVELENLAQDYQDKLDRERLTPAAAGTARP